MTDAAVWFSVSGEGEPLVALHPGGTDSRAMEPLLAELSDYRRIMIDRPGHVRSADSPGPWSFEDMADVVAVVLDELRVGSAHVVGWSDGAIVGLHLALRRPELVRTLVIGARVFQHEGWRDGVLGGEPPEFMGDAYAELSPDGRDHLAGGGGEVGRPARGGPPVGYHGPVAACDAGTRRRRRRRGPCRAPCGDVRGTA